MVPYRPYNFNTITIRLEVQKGRKCICLLPLTYCQPLTQSQAYGCCSVTKLCLTLLTPCTVTRASQVAQGVKNPPANAGDTETQAQSLDREGPLEEGMATHSSILA